MKLILRFWNSPHFEGYAMLVATFLFMAFGSLYTASLLSVLAFFGLLAGNIVEAINKLGDKNERTN